MGLESENGDGIMSEGKEERGGEIEELNHMMVTEAVRP